MIVVVIQVMSKYLTIGYLDPKGKHFSSAVVVLGILGLGFGLGLGFRALGCWDSIGAFGACTAR